MQKAYASIAPHPENWPTLAEKTGKMVSQEYDWSEAVPAISAPVMIVIGDADSIRPAHAVKFFELLGGGKADAGWDGSEMSRSRLAILPGITHYNIFASPALVSVVIPFLMEPMPEDGSIQLNNMLDKVNE
jgi:pimeloyl-ACP methyl ester carboxylesterase